MNERTGSSELIASTNLREYFYRALDGALSKQGVDAAVETIHYLVNLLTVFQRADRLFEYTGEAMEIKPLAMQYADALESRTPEERNRVMQRMGDVALFVSGLFSDSLNRRLVDVGYYIAMGSGAYGYLSESLRGSHEGVAFCDIFDELSLKFPEFVDVLSEVNDRASGGSHVDILRLYERWLRTGNRRARERLRALGIEPASGSAAVMARVDH